MAFSRKLTAAALILALVMGLAFPAALADNVPQPKRTIKLFVSKSSSQQLLETNTADMYVGDKLTFVVGNTYNKNEKDLVGWYFLPKDENVVSRTNNDKTGVNTIKALKPGSVQLIFRNVISVEPRELGDAELILTFNVSYATVGELKLSTEAATVKIGDTKKITATVLPEKANQSVTWTSSDPAVAKVGLKGVVTGVSRGTATITCTTAEGGLSKECSVTVIPKKPDPESLTIKLPSLEIKVGKNKKLGTTILPKNANKKVTWTSSDPAVAKITKSGVVKAVAPGTATITCKTQQADLSATCEVTVVPKG